jgi:hypothetical protein
MLPVFFMGLKPGLSDQMKGRIEDIWEQDTEENIST